MNINHKSRRKLLLFGCLVLCPIIVSLIIAWPLIVIAFFGMPKVPWSLAEQLPETIVVLDEIADQSGMDSFFLVRANFSSEHEIANIRDEFNLLPNQDDVSPLSFSGLYDKRENIDWFPLSNVTRRYSFTTKNQDGTQKKNFETRGYEAVIWIDDDRKEFILQLACL